MTVPVTAAVARRLQSLGHLAPPLPVRHDGRFQEAVKAFQASIGLPPDGILGPRTTLALSRVIAGKFGPATEVTRSR
jgi:murein L,D-transpeptidase YcbB/YkuD